MNRRNAAYFGGIAVVVLAIGGLAAATHQGSAVFTPVKPKPAKVCPINFVLDPVTSLQAHFAADIEKTNADLAVILVKLRRGDAIPALSKECAERFSGTYLSKPVLWDESGVPIPEAKYAGKDYERWMQILSYLKTIILERTGAIYLHPQAVTVYLEYLPPDRQTQAYLIDKRSVNLGSYRPDEVDFLAMIRTVIAYAPYDDPMELGNEDPIPHRKVCDPIY